MEILRSFICKALLIGDDYSIYVGALRLGTRANGITPRFACGK